VWVAKLPDYETTRTIIIEGIPYNIKNIPIL